MHQGLSYRHTGEEVPGEGELGAVDASPCGDADEDEDEDEEVVRARSSACACARDGKGKAWSAWARPRGKERLGLSPREKGWGRWAKPREKLNLRF